MDRKKRTAIKRYITLGLAALVTAGLAAMPMLTAKEAEEGTKASTLSAVAQTASLDRVLIGGGSIAAKDEVEVTIPSGVKVTALLANNGDVVSQGQPIAQVDKVSVMTAIRDAQEALDTVTADLNTVRGKITPGTITVDEDGTLYVAGKKVEQDKLENYAQFLSLSDQHREYAEILLELFRMNRLGTVNAPAAGMIDGLDKSIVQKLSFEGNVELSLLSELEEEEPTEPEIVTYTCYGAQIVTVSGPQMAVLKGPAVQVEDLNDLSAVDMTALTELALVGNMAVYNIVGEEWEAYTPATGDLIVVVTDPEGITFGLKQAGTTPDVPDIPEDSEESERVPGSGGFGGFGGGSSRGQQSSTPELYSTASTPLCTLVSQETMTLTVSIDERDIASVAPGMKAEITFDALKGKTFEGTVTDVSKFGASSGGSSKFEVTLELPYSEGMLPGMNACAKMTLERIENVLTIPVAALVEQGTKTLVYTAYDPKSDMLLNPVEVKTGFSDGENVQILSGLTDGLPIWYTYYDVLEISTTAKASGLFG